ncbi:MAG: DNA mismatch repair protein MutS [Thermoanaerobaculia bacterium]|nr:DNA mismatch repair protein MutS [Thermoanaerobaculia bacterium]
MKLTPMLEQYFEIKRQFPDAIVFYRLGDFYEMFFEDAETAAPLLELVLTARGRGGESEAPMCGVPAHSADQYIAKLIRHGFRVAVCEQVEDPAAAKGIVRREVIRVVTPGTAVDSTIIDRESCYLFSWAPGGDTAGGAYLDVSTGDFFVVAYGGIADPRLRDDLARHKPREVVLRKESDPADAELFRSAGLAITSVESSYFDHERAEDFLVRRFGTQSLRGFGLERGDLRVAAAGAALRYASAAHKSELGHIGRLRVESGAGFLLLDASTLENLEILESRDGQAKGSLWSVVNATRTSMGSRALRGWLSRPLLDRDSIFARHDAVDELTRSRAYLEELTKTLGRIADLERLATRVTVRTASPRECLTLADSLDAVGELGVTAGHLRGPLLLELAATLDPLADVSAKLRATIGDEPSMSARDGGVIRVGVDADLDDLRAIARDSKSILLRIEEEERAKTGISSLKVRFNSVFGYYIEVSKTNLAKVPAEYIRKQTLVNAERFITPELKVIEDKILRAEERSIAIEVRLYEALLVEVGERASAILDTARAVGTIDAIASFATSAIKHRWCRATLSDEMEVDVDEGRHPVVESLTTRFIPNDTRVHRDRNGIQIITGPNMGGKSTYLRQVALLVLLNQAGSFVPATRARLGVFDRVFTRVGASDNLARGESTFMVEMHETANILNNATDRSLVILDEVGRGTATFDGLSLAWAIVEYLHDTARGAVTLFATHYHELTDLAETNARVCNYNVAVKEWNDQIIFLRKVVEGAADKSYGIHVAKLAGIPGSVVHRAEEILKTLEAKEVDVVEATRKGDAPLPGSGLQLTLFGPDDRGVLGELRQLSVDTLTPVEALNKIHEWKKRFQS